MGAINDENNVIFLNFSLGKIRQSVKEGTPKAVSRVNKNQKTVWELVHDAWVGRLEDITTRKTKFGTEIQLVVDDGDEVAKIGMMYTSDMFLDFANRLLSFTPKELATQSLIIRPFAAENEKDGKTYTNNMILLKLANEEDNRKRKYEKDDPELPDWELVDNPKGEGMVYNQNKQRKFLAEKIAALIAEVKELRNDAEESSTPKQQPQNEPEHEPEDVNTEVEDDDDLPF